MTIKTILCLIFGAVLLTVGLVGFAATKHAVKQGNATKKQKRVHTLFFALLLIAAWFLLGSILTALSSSYEGLKVELEMFSPRITLFGVSFAQTTVTMWVLILLVLVFSLIFRFVIFPRFDLRNPKGFQNLIELSVDAMENLVRGTLGDYSDQLAPYMYSLALFMVFSAFAEMLGLRAPTSDLPVTFAMGLLTFILINLFGIRKKGVGGRIKSLAQPTPIVFPMKILSDIAVPVSLACRLFGNMLGGLIVMDLLKSVLGGYASGLPAVLGIYFNVFHPLIQAYIFIILSMTFINEAIE